MYPTRGIFDFCASADNPSAKSKAHRAKQNIFLMPIGSCLISRGRDRPCERPPRTDPYVRDYLIRLLPRVHLTAHRSLGYRYHPFLPLAVRATNLCDSLPRLCVRHECACGAFPLVDLLPSADSAANAPALALFARFTGTMRPSDSLQTCMSTLRPLAFFDRPALLSSVGVCRASRFPRMELSHMPRVSDSAVLKDRSRLTLPFMLPSPYQDTVGTPKW